MQFYNILILYGFGIHEYGFCMAGINDMSMSLQLDRCVKVLPLWRSCRVTSEWSTVIFHGYRKSSNQYHLNILNEEIFNFALFRWLRLCVRSKDQSKLNDVFNFVNSQGRMKYVRPLYRDLYAWEDVREQAIENFLKNEKYMMHVSAYTLRKDLHLTEKTIE